MHGLGNDFVVLDGRARLPVLAPEWIRCLADRRRGVGCDQVLVVESPADSADADFAYRVFNADGSQVQQCGNGVRCIARWLYDRKDGADVIRLAGAAGVVQAQIVAADRVEVAMGQPEFEPARIPLAATPAEQYTVQLDGRTWAFSALSMGNPHAVIEVEDLANAPVAAVGRQLQQHPMFPESVNVGFAQVASDRHIALRVFERGAGETRACGSGACAAVVALHHRARVGELVTVQLPGGELQIQWSGPGAQVMMAGPAAYAFTGYIDA